MRDPYIGHLTPKFRSAETFEERLLIATEICDHLVLGFQDRGADECHADQNVMVNFLRKADANWRGSIVNVSSISATVASVNRGDYCISKAGVAMATQLWAARLGEFDIPVYEVRPGVIKTDMTAVVTEKYDKLFASGLAIQARWGMPADVGKAVAALARGDFPYSTGQVIMVDGGLTVQRL